MSESGQSRPSLRAKDSDREAVLEVLNNAFVEGQLDPAEHQRRVDVALGAPTVGSLSALTVDLQLSAAVFRDLAAKGLVPVVPPTTPAARAVGAPEPATKLVWAKGRIAALAVALLLPAGCVGISSAISWQNGGSESSDSALSTTSEQSANLIDEPYLDDFVQAYEAKFHTTMVVSAVTDEEGLRVVVPAVASATRPSVYDYDGVRFVKVAGTSPAAQPNINLADLDTATIAALPDRVVEELDVDDPESIDLLIGQTDHGPGVQVTVVDADGDTATMTTDVTGRRISTSAD